MVLRAMDTLRDSGLRSADLRHIESQLVGLESALGECSVADVIAGYARMHHSLVGIEANVPRPSSSYPGADPFWDIHQFENEVVTRLGEGVEECFSQPSSNGHDRNGRWR